MKLNNCCLANDVCYQFNSPFVMIEVSQTKGSLLRNNELYQLCNNMEGFIQNGFKGRGIQLLNQKSTPAVEICTITCDLEDIPEALLNSLKTKEHVPLLKTLLDGRNQCMNNSYSSLQ